MADTETENEPDQVMISIAALNLVSDYTKAIPPASEVVEWLDRINANFKELPNYKETNIEILDAAMVQFLIKHSTGQCHYGFSDHVFAQDVIKQCEEWQAKRIFKVCEEEKIPLNGAKKLDMNKIAHVLADRAEVIFNAIEAATPPPDPEDASES
jgi:hypothetical protein